MGFALNHEKLNFEQGSRKQPMHGFSAGRGVCLALLDWALLYRQVIAFTLNHSGEALILSVFLLAAWLTY